MYDEFINSLSDSQLELIYAAIPDEDNDTDFANAVADAYYNREQKTVKFSVEQSLVDKYKSVLKEELAEDQHGMSFPRSAIVAMRNKRIFNGWSDELETAVKAILYEVLEQL